MDHQREHLLEPFARWFADASRGPLNGTIAFALRALPERPNRSRGAA